MLDALAITEAEAAGLSELAALDLAMARDFAARARAEQDPDLANDLARSYQRMARSYRQSLALKARLAREIALAATAAEDAHREAQPRAERLARRKAQVRYGVERFIDEQLETLEIEAWDDADVRAALEERLAAWSRTPGFEQEPVDLLTRRILEDLDPLLEAAITAALDAADAEAADAPAPPFESSA